MSVTIEFNDLAILMSKTNATDEGLDFALVKEFEYRKKKIELIEDGRKAIDSIQEQLAAEDSIEVLRRTAATFAAQGINQVIENVDNAIVAFESARKYNSALNAVKMLLVLIVLSNLLTALVLWLILR